MPFEVDIIEYLQSFSTPFIDGFFKVTAYFFDYPLVIVLGLLLLCFKKYSKLLLFLAVEAVGALVQVILKSIINRPRPYISHASIMNILEASNSSFPSGHSITCMCAVVVLWYMINQSSFKKQSKILMKLGLVVACLVCALNRMYLGQHYLTDVLGGFIIAVIIAIIGVWVYKVIINKIYNKKSLSLK